MTRLHRPKAGFWIRLCVVIVYPLTSLLFRIRWRHADRMPGPEAGGVIVVINHISYIDTLLMARLVWHTGRVPRFMIKAGVFTKPFVGTIMRGAKQIPVSRGSTEAKDSLNAAITALKHGEAVVIYPEGTITRDPANWPMQAKTGLARLVLLAPDVPVIPIGQWGAQHNRPHHYTPRRTATASVGLPVDLSRFRGQDVSVSMLREITDTIMRAVRAEVAEVRGEPAPDAFFRTSQKFVD
jgi:1-acyl-sn-glycerol-3-phosphate acyltransferase